MFSCDLDVALNKETQSSKRDKKKFVSIKISTLRKTIDFKSAACEQKDSVLVLQTGCGILLRSIHRNKIWE